MDITRSFKKSIYLSIRLVFIGLAKVIFKFEVRGAENLPRTGAAIIASNHASYLDPPLIGPRLPCAPKAISYQYQFSYQFSFSVNPAGNAAAATSDNLPAVTAAALPGLCRFFFARKSLISPCRGTVEVFLLRFTQM